MALKSLVYFDSNNERAVAEYAQLVTYNEIYVTVDVNEAKMMLAIGGDGTLIRAIHSVDLPDMFNIGLIGVGTVNYLAMGDNPVTHTINMLECTNDPYDNDRYFAMNEIAIKAEDDSRMLTFDILIDGELICENVRGDGVIIATAIGSTAYAMSAGGPIIDIGAPVNVIVPNNEYSRKSRPIVLSNERSINIIPKNDYVVYLDGLDCFEGHANDIIDIYKGKSYVLWHADSLAREEKNR